MINKIYSETGCSFVHHFAILSHNVAFLIALCSEQVEGSNFATYAQLKSNGMPQTVIKL